MTHQFKAVTPVGNVFFANENQFFDYCDYLRENGVEFSKFELSENGEWKEI
jgi:hypothetical protein